MSKLKQNTKSLFIHQKIYLHTFPQYQIQDTHNFKKNKKRHNRVHISSFDCNSLSSNQEDYNNNNNKKKKKNNWNYKAKIWKEKQRGRKGLITCNTKNEDEEEKRLKVIHSFLQLHRTGSL